MCVLSINHTSLKSVNKPSYSDSLLMIFGKAVIISCEQLGRTQVNSKYLYLHVCIPRGRKNIWLVVTGMVVVSVDLPPHPYLHTRKPYNYKFNDSFKIKSDDHSYLSHYVLQCIKPVKAKAKNIRQRLHIICTVLLCQVNRSLM